MVLILGAHGVAEMIALECCNVCKVILYFFVFELLNALNLLLIYF